MVARNFSLQDLSYSRLLQVPDEEREFLALEELKPYQLTELGLSTQNSIESDQNSLPQQSNPEVTAVNDQNAIVDANSDLQDPSAGGQYGQVYYDLNAQQTTKLVEYIWDFFLENN